MLDIKSKCFRLDDVGDCTVRVSVGDSPNTCKYHSTISVADALKMVEDFRRSLIKRCAFWDCVESHDCFIDEYYFTYDDTVPPTKKEEDLSTPKKPHVKGFFKKVLENKEQNND